MKKPAEAAKLWGLLVLLSVLVYWPVFSSPRLPGGELSDTVHQGYPFLAYTEASLRQGELPLWNPLVFGGVPFYASFSAPVFYPLRGLPLLLLGPEASVRFLFPVHLVLAGFFAWLLLGAMGTSREGRFAGAFAYCLGAWANTLFYAGHGSKVICWAFLPLLLYAVTRFMTTRSAKWIGLGALAVGMQGLSSHPQMMIYSGGMAVVFSLWRLGHPREWWWKITGFAAMMALGILVAAVQLYPGYLFSAHSTRGDGLDPATAASYSMPPEETLTMLLPSAFGLRHGFTDSTISGVPVYFGRLGLRLSSEFTGVLVFIMAMAGFVAGRDRKTRGALLTLAIVGTVVSWGGYTGLFSLLYRAIPLFQKIRAPHMAAFITTTSVALAAGPGFDVFFSRGASRKQIIAVAAAAALFLVTLPLAGAISEALQAPWWKRMGVPGGSGYEFMVRHRGTLLRADLLRALLSSSALLLLLYASLKLRMKVWLSAAGVVLITAFELVPFNRNFQVYLNHTTLEGMYRADPELAEMAGSGRVFPGGNELVPLGIRSVTGYHAAKPAVVDRMVTLLSGATPRMIHQFGVTAFKFPEGAFSWSELHSALSEDDPTLSPTPMPRAFIPARAASGTGEQGFQALVAGSDVQAISVIDASADDIPAVCSGTVRITVDTPHEVILGTSSRSTAVVVLADTWYPRWRAEVNGIPTEIHVANGWMRAVTVPPGDNTVRFHYDGSDVILGRHVSILATALALALLLLSGRQRKRR
ncbi:MAG: hypothetical protein R6V62_06495 [Candidatus Fermentibacteraceae bacterium]